MTIGFIEPESLVKYISRDCKYRFDRNKCNSDQKWNKEICWCKCKRPLKQEVVYGKCAHEKCAPGISACRCQFLRGYQTIEQIIYWLNVKLN